MPSAYCWAVQDSQPLVNSIGLIFDILGAACVCIEVVNQFRGNQFVASAGIAMQDAWGTPVTMSPPPKQTSEYSRWEHRKYLWMKVGLFFLVVGFVFQIASNWLPISKVTNATQMCVEDSSATKG